MYSFLTFYVSTHHHHHHHFSSGTTDIQIYTTQPIFSSLFAFALLGETLGKAGIAGGSMIALALWLITASSSSENEAEA